MLIALSGFKLVRQNYMTLCSINLVTLILAEILRWHRCYCVNYVRLTFSSPLLFLWFELSQDFWLPSNVCWSCRERSEWLQNLLNCQYTRSRSLQTRVHLLYALLNLRSWLLWQVLKRLFHIGHKILKESSALQTSSYLVRSKWMFWVHAKSLTEISWIWW